MPADKKKPCDSALSGSRIFVDGRMAQPDRQVPPVSAGAMKNQSSVVGLEEELPPEGPELAGIGTSLSTLLYQLILDGESRLLSAS